MTRWNVIALTLSLMTIVACQGEEQSRGTTPAQSVVSELNEPSTRLIQDRFVIFDSALDVQGTVNALLEALDRRDMTVFSIIDHQAGAQNIGANLPPSTLVIFGNPKSGTPLISASPLMGAELPIRALIYEEDGQTRLALTGVDFLQRQYGLSRLAGLTNKLEENIQQIAAEATSFK